MATAKIKKSDGTWIEIGGGTKVYKQESEPTEAKAGDMWATEEDESTPFLQKIYDITFPVGSTKVCLNASDIPVVPEGVTATWEIDTTYDGKALWVDSTQDIGTSINGELPNIEGSMANAAIGKNAQSETFDPSEASVGGFISCTAGYADANINGAVANTWQMNGQLYFNAASIDKAYSGTPAGSSAYGTVRPTSVSVKVYKRTA